MDIKSFNNITVFTDGSCVGNGKKCAKAGVGVYFPNNEFDNISEKFTQAPITNQRAELYAIYEALNVVTKKSKFDKVTIYTDSLYSIKSLTEWIKKWEMNNWKTANNKDVMNLDIIRPIYSFLVEYKKKIEFKHVRSHTNAMTYEARCNDAVDKLACAGTLKNNAPTPKRLIKKAPVKVIRVDTS